MTRLTVVGVMLSFAIGCGSDRAPRIDASTGTDASSDVDASTDLDADTDLDAGPPPACSFNSDCDADRRCECTEEDGCFCLPGARGTGVNGVDECTSGNDCESALCIEGAESEGSTFYCSGECATDDDCGARLPRCSDIAFVGRVCVRAAGT